MEEKSEAAKREEATLVFWNEKNIFEKSLSKNAPRGEYVFYDGPPFATGTPHYGHIVASVIKDAVPRYWTMQGYRVPRQWGWDCHGLPIENIVEKELGFKHKKDIVNYGVAKFNEACRSKVLMYADEWKKVIPRIGRWADMEHPYFTMSRNFMESVWWTFKQLYDKGLVYEDYRIMHVCPRCETTLSQSEVTEGYKDVKDLSVTVKFKLRDPSKLGLHGDVYMLAWTTTPWTLPGNVALAVNSDVEYVAIKTIPDLSKAYERGIIPRIISEQFVIARGALSHLPEPRLPTTYNIAASFKGRDLEALQYEPPFDYYINDKNIKNRENGWKVYAADFVTADEGTGIAHEAPAFGADDWELAKKYNLPFIQHVNFDGTFKPEVTDFAGEDLSPRAKNNPEEVREVDLSVVKYLEQKGLLFAKEKYLHSYPHCWRCDTPLLNYATSSWFVKIEAQKEKLLETAKPINWSPEHIKRGRWGKWLEGARDWSISRQRFWASVIPIWRCEKCKDVRVFGSASELEKASGQTIDDLHKHIVDEITVPCTKCEGTMKRIPDVLDTWFDSGSMPYGQAHYPFESVQGDSLYEYKDSPRTPPFPSNFPAQFIAEGQDQCRAWFYYLHVLASSIFEKSAFEHVIVNGIVLAEDGKKMSKKLKNYPDPMTMIEKHGADALRLYLLASPVVQAENLNFSEKGVSEWKGVLTRLENVLSFYRLYKAQIAHEVSNASAHVLDRWLFARFNQVHAEVTETMNAYDLARATRPLSAFIDDLSQWYLRRSRERIKDGEADALSSLAFVLREFSKTLAPFAPFMAEHLWQELRQESDEESVHLSGWPVSQVVDHEVISAMTFGRNIVTMGLMQRASVGIKVRQPLRLLSVVHAGEKSQGWEEIEPIVADEVNVEAVTLTQGDMFSAHLDTTITPELKEKGQVREFMREIQAFRKESGLMPGELVSYRVPETIERALIEKYRAMIEKATNTKLEQ